MDIKARIRDRALGLGLEAVGFPTPDAVAGAGPRLEEFLRLGRHGDMHWLAAKADRRRHPRALWPEAKSVIACAMNYAPRRDPLTALERAGRAALSCYAQGADYHDVL